MWFIILLIIGGVAIAIFMQHKQKEKRAAEELLERRKANFHKMCRTVEEYFKEVAPSAITGFLEGNNDIERRMLSGAYTDTGVARAFIEDGRYFVGENFAIIIPMNIRFESESMYYNAFKRDTNYPTHKFAEHSFAEILVCTPETSPEVFDGLINWLEQQA